MKVPEEAVSLIKEFGDVFLDKLPDRLITAFARYPTLDRLGAESDVAKQTSL